MSLIYIALGFREKSKLNRDLSSTKVQNCHEEPSKEPCPGAREGPPNRTATVATYALAVYLHYAVHFDSSHSSLPGLEMLLASTVLIPDPLMDCDLKLERYSSRKREG